MNNKTKPEDIVDQRYLLIGDAECVDHVNDYRRIIDNILKLSQGKFRLTSFSGTEQEGIRRIEITINNEVKGQLEVEGNTDWLDPQLVKAINEILLGVLGDYKFVEFREEDWGQEFGIAYLNKEQWRSFIEAGFINQIHELENVAEGESKVFPVQSIEEYVPPMDYEEVEKYSEGLAGVKKDGKYGYINSNNQLVIKPKYERCGYFKNGFATVKLNGKYGFIDKEGNERTPFLYDDAWGNYAGRYAFVYINGIWSAVDMNGSTLATFDYEQVMDWNGKDELVCVRKNGKWGCIDRTFHLRIPCIYNYWLVFSEGYASVTRSLVRRDDLNNPFERITYVDVTGREIMPFLYDEGGLFKEGLARVREGNKWGYVNTEGKVAIPLIYDSTDDFKNGQAVVKKNNRLFKINTNGEEIALKW